MVGVSGVSFCSLAVEGPVCRGEVQVFVLGSCLWAREKGEGGEVRFDRR